MVRLSGFRQLLTVSNLMIGKMCGDMSVIGERSFMVFCEQCEHSCAMLAFSEFRPVICMLAYSIIRGLCDAALLTCSR